LRHLAALGESLPVSAGPDESFVCRFHVTSLLQERLAVKSKHRNSTQAQVIVE
jgi:hypothetical protein